jgi:cytochrome P450
LWTSIPWLFCRYIPTSKNRYAWKIDRKVKEILSSVIPGRLEPRTTTRTHVGNGNDLLGVMMTASKKELCGIERNISMNIDEIMDECKTVFFTGHETTSNLLTWTVFLLMINSE